MAIAVMFNSCVAETIIDQPAALNQLWWLE